MKHEKKLSKAQIWNRYWVPAIEYSVKGFAVAVIIAAFVACAGIVCLAA